MWGGYNMQGKTSQQKAIVSSRDRSDRIQEEQIKKKQS